MVDFENGSGPLVVMNGRLKISIWTVQQIQAQPSASPTAKKSDRDLIRISYSEYGCKPYPSFESKFWDTLELWQRFSANGQTQNTI